MSDVSCLRCCVRGRRRGSHTPPWSNFTLHPPHKVAKADPSVLKPELVEVVSSALAGYAEETLSLVDFCELLDASVKKLLSEGGPTAHLFASGEKKARPKPDDQAGVAKFITARPL